MGSWTSPAQPRLRCCCAALAKDKAPATAPPKVLCVVCQVTALRAAPTTSPNRSLPTSNRKANPTSYPTANPTASTTVNPTSNHTVSPRLAGPLLYYTGTFALKQHATFRACRTVTRPLL